MWMCLLKMLTNSPCILKLVCAGFAILSGAGCINSVDPVADSEKVEHRYRKNYTIGDKLVANVGEPLIVVQDFWLKTKQGKAAIPDQDVDVKIGGFSGALGSPTFVFKSGEKYQIKGTKEIDGVTYTVVATEDMIQQLSEKRNLIRTNPNSWLGLLIKSDGTIDQSRIWWQVPANGFLQSGSISAPSVSFRMDKIETVLEQKGYENYEILYTGVNASGMNLTYREFSREGLARVAFFQNLTYELGVQNISFKKFRIAVESATSERIVFRVLDDGLTKTR